MFTGIVTDLGTVASVTAPRPEAPDRRMRIATAYDMATVADGASIACNGACLTVVAKGPGWFEADVSAETLAKTTLAAWRTGTRVNLERALRMGDELGGHLVSGHVDGVGRVEATRRDGDSTRFVFAVPGAQGRQLAPKGSVALDGVSLTVNEVEDRPDGSVVFGVNIIPHTRTVTTFGGLSVGDRVNVEIDLLARYVARLLATDAAIPAATPS
jgi:riboflavin synthase